jgi:hypothetical protein
MMASFCIGCMQLGQKALMELQQSVETHAEGWEWKEAEKPTLISAFHALS